MRKEAVVAILRTAVEKAGSASAWARAHRLSPRYVLDVLHGTRAPGPRVLAALGLTSETVYRTQGEEASRG